MEGHTRFFTTSDGARIAYAVRGQGFPLISVHGWAGVLEYGRQHPQAQALRETLSEGRMLVNFDRRALGDSEGDLDDVTLEKSVSDISDLADHLDLPRFDLWGASDGAPVAIAYAAQHPERVSRLALWGPFARVEDTVQREALEAVVEFIDKNWSLARRTIADVCFPSGPTEVQRWFAGMVRQTISPEAAAGYLEFMASVDVSDYLPQVKVPTLILHRRGDRSVPISAGRAVAASIPDARFVPLEGDISAPYPGDIEYLSIMVEFFDEGHVEELSAGALAGAVHTILFTDMESSTALTQQLGDAGAQDVRRVHNEIVRAALPANGGSEIKHTGDGIMASFASASGAIECAIAIQQGVARHRKEQPESPLAVYIGLNAGEPIAEDGPDGRADLFGTSVDLARRICDHAGSGQILASDVVRQLAAGKGFLFADTGEVALKGFEDPVRLYEVRWREEG